VTQVVWDARTSLLALSLAVALAGTGAAQTPPASISITDLPESVEEGSPVSFTVTVLDAAGAPVMGYLGTVHFSSSLAGTVLPDDYTFAPDDRGSHEFSFTPKRAGAQTIRVTDVSAGLHGWDRTRVETGAQAPQSASDLAPRPASDQALDAEGGQPVRMSVATGGHLYFVAHQDDDLLFLNPDVEDSIRKGLRVRTVFLTAAASSPTPPPTGDPAWYAREDGVARAYRAMANVAQVANDWTCANQTYLPSKVVRVCTLNTQPLVSVVFMRLPDGGTDPVNQPGMAALWAGSVVQLTSFTRPEVLPTPSSTYTRAQLIQVLSALIADFAPDGIGTQDSTQAYGPDHSDHIASAQFALEADHMYSSPHDLRMYRGYNVDIPWGPPPAPEVENLSPAQHDEKLRIFETYNGPAGSWAPFCWRRYAIERLVGGVGPIAAPGGLCINAGSNPAAGDPAVAANCSGGTTQWTVRVDGRIADPNGMCLLVDTDGKSVRVYPCISSPAQTWSFMSNGQLRGAGATCLTVGTDGVTLQALPCQSETYSSGQYSAPAAGLSEEESRVPAVAQPKPNRARNRYPAVPVPSPPSYDKYVPAGSQRWVQRMGDPAGWSSGTQFSDADLVTPGSFRLGDVNGDGYADACIRRADGVYCALNTGAGGFASYSLYSDAFADAGSTIQLGDVNGDGKADVCGRSANGIVCATANATGTSFGPAAPWSAGTDFSDGDGWAASAAYYGSIRLADVNGDGYADVCGRSANGIICALNNKLGGFAPASVWIADFTDALGWNTVPYGTTLQFADVNGDGKADVCGRGPAGIRCAIANAAGTGFTDAHQWSLRNDFSDADGWGASAGSYGSIRLADVNGDGYADVCGRSSGGIVCGFSNGGGFDVARPLMPQGYTDALGWAGAPYGATIQFGDLGHDGRRDVCGRGPSGLVCAKAP